MVGLIMHCASYEFVWCCFKPIGDVMNLCAIIVQHGQFKYIMLYCYIN
ncbi:hypothetical protein SAMN04488688_104319 [Paenibacillus sp. cl141a]|nr:hypothetical protein SAMN04488688_104319 [Paenibacillus sp. cl141a]